MEDLRKSIIERKKTQGTADKNSAAVQVKTAVPPSSNYVFNKYTRTNPNPVQNQSNPALRLQYQPVPTAHRVNVPPGAQLIMPNPTIPNPRNIVLSRGNFSQGHILQNKPLRNKVVQQ